MLIFVRLIFVAVVDYENIFTTKISRFTVLLYNVLLSLQKFIGVWTPGRALLYCIACPVGPFFKTGVFEPVSLYADPKFVRAWPGGIGEFKMGA